MMPLLDNEIGKKGGKLPFTAAARGAAHFPRGPICIVVACYGGQKELKIEFF